MLRARGGRAWPPVLLPVHDPKGRTMSTSINEAQAALDEARSIAQNVAWIAGSRISSGDRLAMSVSLAITAATAMAALRVGYAHPPRDYFASRGLADLSSDDRLAVREVVELYLDLAHEDAELFDSDWPEPGDREFFAAEEARARRVLDALSVGGRS